MKTEDQDQWAPVSSVEEVPENGVLLAWAEAEPIALYKLAGAIYATSDNCTHGSGSLSEGSVCGENIECPMHQGQFHIPSGRAAGVPCVEDLKCYPVRIEGGTVYIKM